MKEPPVPLAYGLQILIKKRIAVSYCSPQSLRHLLICVQWNY